jgi:hypothetical protein
VAVVGDDAGETAELRAAFGDWAAGQAEAGVEATVAARAGDGAITVESCAG